MKKILLIMIMFSSLLSMSENKDTLNVEKNSIELRSGFNYNSKSEFAYDFTHMKIESPAIQKQNNTSLKMIAIVSSVATVGMIIIGYVNGSDSSQHFQDKSLIPFIIIDVGLIGYIIATNN